MSFEELLRLYLEALRTRHRSRSAQKLAEQVLPRFFQSLKRKDIRSVTEADIVRFVDRVRNRDGAKPSPWTLHTYLSTIRTFFSFLESRKLILANPAENVSLPKAKRLPRRMLTTREVRRIVTSPLMSSPESVRNRALLELLYGTGIRLSECVRTNLGDLDLREETLLVRNGKGRKDRIVPVVGEAIAALDRYIKDARPLLAADSLQGALFVSQQGTRVSSVSVGVIVREAARKLGLAASPHLLRHACATHLLQAGADVRRVQELLGHKNLDTTALYTHVVVDDLRKTLEKAHPSQKAKRRKPR